MKPQRHLPKLRCKSKPSLRELVTTMSLKLDRMAKGLGQKVKKIMSKLTEYEQQLKTANVQLDAMGQGLTNIGKDMAKLAILAINAHTPEEIVAVDTQFGLLSDKLGKFGADVAAIDAVYETEPDAEPPVEPQP